MADVRKGKRKPMAEINVVPYIDVMLVLLIIFMVTAPLLMQGVKVELPQAPSAPIDQKQDEPLIVSIKADGSYFVKLGGDPESSKPLEEIKNMVGIVLKRAPETPILVWGDTSVPYGKVVALMSELQNAGAGSVGLVTEPPG
ncbi:protein TolR [Aurantivibrio plasticivorans]